MVRLTHILMERNFIFIFFIYLESASCNEGEIRLVNGSSDQSGRLEVCTDQTWGCVCSTGFDVTDAYVVCRELGLGISGINVLAINCFKDFKKIRAYCV